jgi:hypothetical protein
LRALNGLASAAGITACLAISAVAPAGALAGEQVRTNGGEVVAPRPSGWGWTCAATGRTGDGFKLSEVRCSRALPRGDVFLYAKDYAGPTENLDSLCAQDWKAHYRALLPSILVVDAKLALQGKKRVCAVSIEGTSAKGQRVRLREWYAVVPRHVLLITAMGPAEAMATAPSWIGARA